MRSSAALLTIALLSVPAVATFSQSAMMMESSGVYVNVGGALTLVPGLTGVPFEKLDPDLNLEHATADGKKTNWDFDLGFGADGALGYDFGSFRADVEFTYLTARSVFDVDKTQRRENDDKADDTLTVLAATANAWYDLDTGTAWSPYIGIGVGAANVQVKLATGEGTEDLHFDGNGWGFAYQAGVGVALEVLTGFSLVGGYQFFGTLQTTVTDSDNNTAPAEAGTVSPMLMAHGVQLGMRFLF